MKIEYIPEIGDVVRLYKDNGDYISAKVEYRYLDMDEDENEYTIIQMTGEDNILYAAKTMYLEWDVDHFNCPQAKWDTFYD